MVWPLCSPDFNPVENGPVVQKPVFPEMFSRSIKLMYFVVFLNKSPFKNVETKTAS